MVDILDLVEQYFNCHGEYPPNWTEEIYLRMRNPKPETSKFHN